jgi:excisionase family DNA binding protein
MNYLTTKDAADRLGIKPRSVVQLIRRGLLPAVKFGRDYGLLPADVERYLTERRPAHRPSLPKE